MTFELKLADFGGSDERLAAYLADVRKINHEHGYLTGLNEACEVISAIMESSEAEGALGPLLKAYREVSEKWSAAYHRVDTSPTDPVK